MKKFINDPADLVDELLEGYALAYPDAVTIEEPRIVLNRGLEGADRVAIVSIGGSGHEPCACGYVGDGMLDAFAAGDIFVAPGADETFRAVSLADRGKGVLLVILNHAGDLISGRATVERCAGCGIDVRMVVVQDDISTAPRTDSDNRRGLVGCVPIYKIAGAAAAQGMGLDEVAAIAQRLADQMATLAVGVRGATHPVSGKLLAEFGEDDMEIGMGQHGEEGGGRMRLRSADDTARIMMGSLLADLGITAGEKVLLMVNGMGSTTMMELLLVFRGCMRVLGERSVEAVARKVGNVLTVQEAAGFQINLIRMDDELASLWNAPSSAPFFTVRSGS